MTTGSQGGSGQGEAGKRRGAAATHTGDGSHRAEYSFGDPKLGKLRRSFLLHTEGDDDGPGCYAGPVREVR